MILPIKHKRGTTIPTASDLEVGEIAINTDTGLCYTKTGAGNVVAIGLDVAANWGNIGGTLSSQTDLQDALNLKANLSGATFTGKVVTTATATTAPLNIAISTTAPTTTIAGDIWVGTNNIFFKDSTNTQRAVINQNTTNTFSAPQVIDTTNNTQAALRVTQKGTGNAIQVEDSTTPDSTAFIVDQHGKVGIGVAPDASAALKVDTNGIMFGDGTTQTTAAVSPNLSGYVQNTDPRILALSSTFRPQNVQSIAAVNVTFYDGFTGQDETTVVTITSPVGYYHLWTVIFTEALVAGTYSSNPANRTIQFGTASNTMQEALNSMSQAGVDLGGWTIAGSGSPYAPSSVLEFTTEVFTESLGVYSNSEYRFLLREGLFPEIARLAQVGNITNSVVSVDSAGVVGFTDTYADQSQLMSYALLSGANFTGKLTVSMSLAGSPVAQFDQTGSGGCVVIRSTSASSPGHCLRIENRGTGSSLLVEDSITPDTSAFIINNNGVVGIQRPTNWTPATGVFLDVGGKGVFTPSTTHASINVGTITSPPTTLVNGDIWIGNALNFRDQTGASRACVVTNTANTISANTTANPILTVAQTGSTTGVGAMVITNTAPSTALRITQTGAGHALVVEDSTSTDTSSTVIDQNGNVGIGVHPTTFVATEKLEVKGNIKFNDGTVQSTAFTTAQLPTSATATEARLSTNSTKFLTPDTAHWMMMSPNIIQIQRAGFTITNTGTISFATAGWISSTTRTGTAGACSSRWRTFGLSQVDQVWSMTEKTSPASHLNFSNATHCSGRSLLQGITDAVMSWGFYHGKAEADGVGALTRRGYGWQATGGAGSRFLSLEVHDGTTLTSVTSSYAIVDGHAFDWDLISNGAGTVILYVNGTQVATSTAGPTGLVNLTPVIWQEEVATSAAAGSAFNGMVHSRGKFICFDS